MKERFEHKKELEQYVRGLKELNPNMDSVLTYDEIISREDVQLLFEGYNKLKYVKFIEDSRFQGVLCVSISYLKNRIQVQSIGLSKEDVGVLSEMASLL